MHVSVAAFWKERSPNFETAPFLRRLVQWSRDEATPGVAQHDETTPGVAQHLIYAQKRVQREGAVND